jgi:hypothetical protein
MSLEIALIYLITVEFFSSVCYSSVNQEQPYILAIASVILCVLVYLKLAYW